jgi:hypothetical protein
VQCHLILRLPIHSFGNQFQKQFKPLSWITGIDFTELSLVAALD